MRNCREDCLVYAVTDRSWLRGRSLAEQVEEALRGGATMIQFREKTLRGAEREALAREVQSVCRKYNVPFIVNDDVELAVRIGADGAHVGQEDMEAGNVRRLLGPDRILGVTAKTVEQARAAAAAGADYLGSGAVFGSTTKTNAKPMTIEQFRGICGSVDIPVVAIGGVSADNMDQLAGCGMAGFAIVSGIFAAEDIVDMTRRIRQKAEQLVSSVDPAEEPFCPAQVRDCCRRLVEKQRPVVQCITNIVTVNDCANALLAAGASPTMAHHPAEMEDFAKICDALVCNMGATESFEAMLTAARTAREMGHPIVIDPVGCAGSPFRRERCRELMEAAPPACIRGNRAEILALASGRNTGRGVDAGTEGEEIPAGLEQAAASLSRETGAIVIASGETDLLVYGDEKVLVRAGSPWMARITGTGCMLSSLLGAFLAAECSLRSAWACCTWMAQCGEDAEREARKRGAGTGTYRMLLIDALSRGAGER